jgi:crotonobetainyl-CoA:carnitine CoA-transferase CaiB-like acyl-CoA transferase
MLLEGTRVLDLSIWRPGPYATQLLVDLGADVIKVEPPGGDPMRAYPDLFASLNASKRGISLDLKDPADLATALALAADADVIIEGFRPGVVDRLGVGYEAVHADNPSVIYCSISGLGQTGPLAQAPGHDINYQAWSGALAPEGGPPRSAAVPIADLAAGMAAALGVCAALVRRAATGEGELVDVAMTDVLASWTGAVAPQARGTDPHARGVPGYGTFVTADGHHLALGVISEDHFWRPLCTALGLADADATLGFVERMANGEELQARVAGAIAGRDRDELVTALQAVDVPVAPVLDRAGMLALDHHRARGVVAQDPWSTAPSIGYPIRFTEHPAPVPRTPPPALDEHRGATWR